MVKQKKYVPFDSLFTEEEWLKNGLKYKEGEDVVWNVLHDGIYDVTGIPFIVYEYEHPEEARKFIEANPNCVLASAYETNTEIILASKPENISKKIGRNGSGFNYGSTNILQNCPRDILILAEND